MNPADPATLVADFVLIRKAKDGSLDAFNQLVLRYQDLAYHHAYALLGNAASAQDITQESFIKAFRKIRSFRGGSFRAWLLTIVTNSICDLLRTSKRPFVQSLFPEDDGSENIESPAWIVDPSFSVEATVAQNKAAKRNYQLLGELPASYRSVLILVDIFGLDYREVGEILSLQVGTVKSRLARARMEVMRNLPTAFRSMSDRGDDHSCQFGRDEEDQGAQGAADQPSQEY